MRIIQEEDSKTLRFSFYLIGEGEWVVEVWMEQNKGSISYYRYADNFCLDETREGRSESNELHFLLCFGCPANEVFQEGMKVKSGFVCELKKKIGGQDV